MIRIDMSEFMEAHTVARLIGAPPGYVGYGQGGTLTEAVKNRPYSLILLDEFDKAHPDVTNIVLQIADYGRLTDSAGTSVNFRESIMVLTANLAQDQLKRHFRLELLGRLGIVPFRALDDHDLCVIANNELDRLREKLVEKDIVLEYSDDVLLHLVAGLDSDYGARDLKKSIEVQVVQPMANLMLREDFSTIALAANDGELTLTGKRRIEQ
jgi:ATP-dependent Clp protease ATP-binding subunit ClpB